MCKCWEELAAEPTQPSLGESVQERPEVSVACHSCQPAAALCAALLLAVGGTQRVQPVCQCGWCWLGSGQAVLSVVGIWGQHCGSATGRVIISVFITHVHWETGAGASSACWVAHVAAAVADFEPKGLRRLQQVVKRQMCDAAGCLSVLYVSAVK